jgi:hypothetical protein
MLDALPSCCLGSHPYTGIGHVMMLLDEVSPLRNTSLESPPLLHTFTLPDEEE